MNDVPNPLCYLVIQDDEGERFCAAPCLPDDFMCEEHRKRAIGRRVMVEMIAEQLYARVMDSHEWRENGEEAWCCDECGTIAEGHCTGAENHETAIREYDRLMLTCIHCPLVIPECSHNAVTA